MIGSEFKWSSIFYGRAERQRAFASRSPCAFPCLDARSRPVFLASARSEVRSNMRAEPFQTDTNCQGSRRILALDSGRKALQ
jgi:hypothetical protein